MCVRACTLVCEKIALCEVQGTVFRMVCVVCVLGMEMRGSKLPVVIHREYTGQSIEQNNIVA